MTQRGSAATEEDPPNDAKQTRKIQSQLPARRALQLGERSEAWHQSFWRYLACLADHFFSPLGHQNGRVKNLRKPR